MIPSTGHSVAATSVLQRLRGAMRQLREDARQIPFSRSPSSAVLTVAVLYLIGGVAGVTTLLLPHQKGMEHLSWIIAIASIVIGSLLVVRRHHASWRIAHAAYFGGSLLISSSVYFDRSVASADVNMYMWVVMVSAYFFRLAESVLQIGFMAVCYAVVLDRTNALDPVDHSVMMAAVSLTLVVFLNVVRTNMLESLDELATAARTDPLTGLLNRRGLYDVLEDHVEAGEHFGVMLCDIDFFKQINDEYGHVLGDQMLIRVADLLTEMSPPGSTVGRIGGQEFVVAATDLQDVEALEQHALEIVQACSGRLDIHGTPMTISIGIVTSRDTDRDVDSILHAADGALHAAKEFGRNRAVAWSTKIQDYIARNAERASKQREIQITTLSTLCEALDLRDPYTHNHSRVVAELSYELALELGMDEREARRIRVAGTLHDIGKIGIPDEILYKPSKLTDEEFARMRTHPDIGARLLNSVDMLDIREWVLSHHERVDGTGYPRRIAGEHVPMGARILAVADALEAMIADRAYRKGMPVSDALAELHRCAGTQFDVDVAAAAWPVIQRRPDIVDLVRNGPAQTNEPTDVPQRASATPNIHLDLAATLMGDEPEEDAPLAA